LKLKGISKRKKGETMRLTITRLSIDYARKKLAHLKARAGMSPFCVVLALLVAGALPVSAGTIGLCDTGYAGPSQGSVCGSLAGAGGTDGNYKLISNPNNTTSSAAFVVLGSPAASFPFPPWLADTSTSQWIGPVADQHDSAACCVAAVFPNQYTYELTFTTTGTSEAIVGRWLTDNDGRMALDGNLLTVFPTSNSITTWANFSFVVTSATAQPTVHTLDFEVENFSNASGLRVEFAPEPSAFSLLGVGLALVLLGGWKFNSRLFLRTRG
jgi:hypothetical protein